MNKILIIVVLFLITSCDKGDAVRDFDATFQRIQKISSIEFLKKRTVAGKTVLY